MDRYGHLMPGNEAEAVALLDAYLARADTSARLAQLDELLLQSCCSRDLPGAVLSGSERMSPSAPNCPRSRSGG